MVGNYITSFIGFMPANNPKILVYVAIDNPKGIVAYGGTVAAPIARNILLDSTSILRIDKDNGGIEKEYQWFDKKYYTVNDVVGMSAKDAKKVLDKFQVEFSGEGTTIREMSPKAGTRLVEGSIVRLMLGN